jgi:hypothetical protein
MGGANNKKEVVENGWRHQTVYCHLANTRRSERKKVIRQELLE